LNILIVDDEVMVVALIKKHVDWKALGINEVLTAYSVQDAKRKVSECTVDIIVCDIEMPQENGLAFLAWVKQYDPSITNVILTAYPDFQYAQTAISLGVKKYLLKPVSFEELSLTIKNMIKEIGEGRARQQANEIVPDVNKTREERAFYINLLSGDLFPSKESIEQAARESGLSLEKLEPKAIAYIKVPSVSGSAAYHTLKHMAEGMYPDIMEVQLWENIYWIFQEERSQEEIRERCEHFVKNAEDITGGSVFAYYQLHVKLATLSECAYNLRQIAQNRCADGQSVYDADSLIEAAAGAGEEMDKASSWSIAESIMNYIHAHYTEPIGRQDIEEALHMNGDYLNRIFKGVTGYSLIQYIQYYRVLASKRLMSEEHLMVSEAGGKVGFDNPAYFSKVFKKWTKITPYEFCFKIHKKRNV
jgi:two-component system, response regulator YesN